MACIVRCRASDRCCALTVLDSGALHVVCIECGQADCSDHFASPSARCPRFILQDVQQARNDGMRCVRLVLDGGSGMCIGATEAMDECVCDPIALDARTQMWLLEVDRSQAAVRYHDLHWVQPSSAFVLLSAADPALAIDMCREDGRLLVYPVHRGDNQVFVFDSVHQADGHRVTLASVDAELAVALAHADVSAARAQVAHIEGRLACMRRELCEHVGVLPAARSEDLDTGLDADVRFALTWLWTRPRALQCLLDSGGCTDAHDGTEYCAVPPPHRWRTALAILARLVRTHADLAAVANEAEVSPSMLSSPIPLLLRMACATALAFSSGLPSHAGLKIGLLEPLSRFALFKEWACLGILFAEFKHLSAWHLRYVLGSWATNDELAWAQENCPADARTASKVATCVHGWVRYTEHDDARGGVSVHDPELFYAGQAPTMPILLQYGAVCGGISKFGCGMAQAHGVCATPVGQPGHCAYVWRRPGGTFTRLGNQNTGWDETTRHGGAQTPWSMPPFALPFMERCQQIRPAAFSTVERLLPLATLVPLDARADFLLELCDSCPEHLGAWAELIMCVREQGAHGNERPWLNATRAALQRRASAVHMCSRRKPVIGVSENVPEMENLTRPDGSEWRCRARRAWFEIDLGCEHTIASVRLRWWGFSQARRYTLFSRNSSDVREWTLQRTHADATDSGEACNNVHTLPGTGVALVRYVRIELDATDEGTVDPWFQEYFVGLRGCDVFGARTESAHGADDAELATPLGVLCAHMRWTLVEAFDGNENQTGGNDDASHDADVDNDNDDDDERDDLTWRAAAYQHLARLASAR